jgi:nuclear GTP-binding protein
MPKIRKRTSNRVGFREKYACLKKVKDHHKKIKKEAKKLGKVGIKAHPGKKAGIPNSFPMKELLINEMEAEFEMLKSLKEARSKE